ncbi:c-type cytochrome [Stutzerimonas xanthomarina]|uniref:c-type cytochrome n=1 Tax=Stutzerimonas xanthomarina TaxID=271420 RepID=UPI003AA9A0D0
MAALKKIVASIGCFTLMGSALAHEQGHFGIGTQATDAEIAGWYIDVAPDGKNMPDGHATVADGEQLYSTACAACHGTKLEGGIGPALVGGEGSLATSKPVKTVGSYWPYATTLFDYIRRAMPFQQPQSLSNDQVYAVTGYILHKNGLLEADAEIDASTIRNVKMPNRDGFYEDDRPDSIAKACYDNCEVD